MIGKIIHFGHFMKLYFKHSFQERKNRPDILYTHPNGFEKKNATKNINQVCRSRGGGCAFSKTFFFQITWFSTTNFCRQKEREAYKLATLLFTNSTAVWTFFVLNFSPMTDDCLFTVCSNVQPPFLFILFTKIRFF